MGPGNPAAINCQKLGGIIEIEETPNGQKGNCVIDEWTLFRAMLKRGLVTEKSYDDAIGMPNPASVNCIKIGGSLRIVETSQGQAGNCVVDEWALFRVIDVVTKP